MVFDDEPSICMLVPANVSVTLTFDPVTLKTFSAILIHVAIICYKFRWNPSPTWREIASRGIGDVRC